MASRLILWALFAAFVVAALAIDGRAGMFAFDGPYGAGKAIAWLAFAGFLAFTLYCSARESLFATIGKMSALHWGRQIGLDLYIGLVLFLALIALNEGSLLAALLWAAPVLLFGNLATLLYLAIHFDEIAAKFAG